LTVSRIRYTMCTIEATLREAAQDCFVLSFIPRTVLYGPGQDCAGLPQA
jgi:hypothetical protein